MTRVESGDRVRATLTGREYRIGNVGAEFVTAFAPREGDCRCFAVPVDELRRDVREGRIEVLR
jgi:hypothetical protein